MQFILDNMYEREPDHYERASTLCWHHLRKVVRRRLERLLEPNAGSDAGADADTISVPRFRSVLVKHGIVFPEAIEDAEGFDGGRTLAATQAAYDTLMENAGGQHER